MFCGVGFFGRCGENGWMFVLVWVEFGKVGRWEDEGRCGKVGEVFVEGCDRLILLREG